MGSLPSLSPQRTEEAPRAPVWGFFSSGLVDAGALATATGCASDAQLILSVPDNFQLLLTRQRIIAQVRFVPIADMHLANSVQHGFHHPEHQSLRLARWDCLHATGSAGFAPHERKNAALWQKSGGICSPPDDASQSRQAAS